MPVTLDPQPNALTKRKKTPKAWALNAWVVQMSTLSLHSLQMSSCTLRRHIAHWGGQSQNYKKSQVSIHIVGTLADEGIAGKEWELKGLNMLVMFTEQIPCLHCHRIKDIKKNKKNSPKLCSKATAGWHLWLWYLIQAPLWTPCDSLWTARCWLFPNLKATASKSERLLRITTGREYAARYALGWSLTTCLGSA